MLKMLTVISYQIWMNAVIFNHFVVLLYINIGSVVSGGCGLVACLVTIESARVG